jgi:serine/threonine protein kinase
MRSGSTVELSSGVWKLGEPLGRGGYGEVYCGHRGEELAAIKFVPKSTGVPREVLLEIPKDARNVVPITDTGEDGDNWIIAMPLADDSLENVIAANGGNLSEPLALTVLADIAEALMSLDGKIVHRDIKPGNILRLGTKWCLSDFGIARYAEAATGTQTHKGFGSTHYYAPELWRGHSATSQSDMYALGVVAYEMITGRHPFDGTDSEIRDGHLHEEPESTGAPKRLDWAILDCLQKAPELRLTAFQFKEKLAQSAAGYESAGALSLVRANREERRRRELASQQAAQAAAVEEQRAIYLKHAHTKFSRLSDEVRTKMQSLADLAVLEISTNESWVLSLGQASMRFSLMYHDPDWLRNQLEDAPFAVIAHASVTVFQSSTSNDHRGRSHSMWFADAHEEGKFEWFETAFRQNAGMIPTERPIPFDAEPVSDEATAALLGGGAFHVAWPFTPVDADDVDAFADRWAAWFGDASRGQLLADHMQIAHSKAHGSWRPHLKQRQED